MHRWRESLGRVSRDRLDYAAKLDTPAVLRAMGVRANTLDLPTRYLLQIHSDHSDVPQAVFENLPELLADPQYVIPYRNGGYRVFVNTQTAKGEPIIVGLGEGGRIQTITPINDEVGITGIQRALGAVGQALEREGHVYARNEKALASARAASAKASSGLIPLRRDPSSEAKITYCDHLVKRHCPDFYQGG